MYVCIFDWPMQHRAGCRCLVNYKELPNFLMAAGCVNRQLFISHHLSKAQHLSSLCELAVICLFV